VLLPALLLAAPLPLGSPRAHAAGHEVHGERDVFTVPGVVLVWAVLRAPAEEETQVVIRVVLTEGTYAYVRVLGVDPFSGDRRVMTPGGHVAGMVHLMTARRTFADHPRREIRLYRTEDEWKADAPALTIYYLGVPDTTPEFASEAALATYFAEAVARARR
jgi:hypothetical protein